MNSEANPKKLALGTAQFGLPYGIANQSGQVKCDQVGPILELACSSGVTTIDTAIAYGESEQVLGQHSLQRFSVVTKLPEVPENCVDVAEWVIQQVAASLDRLHLPSLDGLLLHRPGQLFEPLGGELFEAMKGLREQGLVRRIGVSVYDPEELDRLFETFQFDLVQAPFSVLDRRLIQSGWLQKFSNMGTALHVRSIFMQGLLLMTKQERPIKFSRWNTLWDEWDRWLLDTGQSRIEACLRHVLSIDEIEKIVVGVDSLSQFQQIISAAKGACHPLPDCLSTCDPLLLNPSNWAYL